MTNFGHKLGFGIIKFWHARQFLGNFIYEVVYSHSMEINSGIAESRPKPSGQLSQVEEKKLSLVEEKIFNLISHRWPTSAIEIAHHFEEDVATREARKKASTKYSYHLKKLV